MREENKARVQGNDAGLAHTSFPAVRPTAQAAHCVLAERLLRVYSTMPALCPRIAASASASSSSRPALAPARAPRAPAGRFPPFPPPARFATPTRAQLGEPSKRPSSSPSQGTPGAPPPAGGGGKEKEKAGADAEQAASDAAAAAEAYVDGVARVAEEGISSAGDVVYAARADAIAAERKVRKDLTRGAGAREAKTCFDLRPPLTLSLSPRIHFSLFPGRRG